MLTTLHIYVPLNFFCCLYILTLHYIHQKSINCNIFLLYYCKICADKNIHIKDKYMLHTQITWHPSMSKVCQYINHIWAHWPQPCMQECSTQMPIWTMMPMWMIILILTSLMIMQLSYISPLQGEISILRTSVQKCQLQKSSKATSNDIMWNKLN